MYNSLRDCQAFSAKRLLDWIGNWETAFEKSDVLYYSFYCGYPVACGL